MRTPRLFCPLWEPFSCILVVLWTFLMLSIALSGSYSTLFRNVFSATQSPSHSALPWHVPLLTFSSLTPFQVPLHPFLPFHECGCPSDLFTAKNPTILPFLSKALILVWGDTFASAHRERLLSPCSLGPLSRLTFSPPVLKKTIGTCLPYSQVLYSFWEALLRYTLTSLLPRWLRERALQIF